MDNNKIIMVLLAIVVVLMVGLLFVGPFNAKENVNLVVSSPNQLCDGDNFVVFLSDGNSTPLANQAVNIVIVDVNGAENPQKITTDESGNAVLQLNGLTPGSYEFNVMYNGNGQYNKNTTTQSVEISEAATSPVSAQSSSSNGPVSIELSSFDHKYSKTVGDYVVEAEKWQGSSIGGFGVMVYKNGQLIDKSSYSSRAYFCMNGEWKWSNWDDGDEDAMYHKYKVSPGVEIQTVEVMIN